MREGVCRIVSGCPGNSVPFLALALALPETEQSHSNPAQKRREQRDMEEEGGERGKKGGERKRRRGKRGEEEGS